jgi:helicase MOV-10
MRYDRSERSGLLNFLGKDMREGSSPSYFNGDEASVVKTYVEALRSNQKLRLSPSSSFVIIKPVFLRQQITHVEDEQIGVISPYNAQCAKIRKLLERSYKGIKVGSTEEFQGQVTLSVLLTTISSSFTFSFRRSVE